MPYIVYWYYRMKNDKSILFLAFSCLCFYVVLSEIYGTKFITNFVNSITAGMNFKITIPTVGMSYTNTDGTTSSLNNTGLPDDTLYQGDVN